MPKEQPKWNLESLKTLMDERELRYSQRFDAQEKAVLKAEASTEKRFESVNEFRNTLKDQQNTFLPRAEYEAAHKDLFNQIGQLSSRMDKKDGEKTGSVDVRGWIFGAAGIIIAIASFVYALLKH
jgi:hypothetical protein